MTGPSLATIVVEQWPLSRNSGHVVLFAHDATESTSRIELHLSKLSLDVFPPPSILFLISILSRLENVCSERAPNACFDRRPPMLVRVTGVLKGRAGTNS